MSYTEKFAGVVALAAVFAFPAHADQSECEAAARAAMIDVRHPVPMRQNIQTVMGEKTIESMALTTPDNRGMSMSADGTPTSLWIDRKFYTTPDNGKTWKLMSEQSPEAQREFMDGFRSQAENATNITCEYDVDLNGKRVNHYALDYVLYNAKTPMHGEYWVDAETKFPWRIVSKSPVNTIIQNNKPEIGATIPDPEG